MQKFYVWTFAFSGIFKGKVANLETPGVSSKMYILRSPPLFFLEYPIDTKAFTNIEVKKIIKR